MSVYLYSKTSYDGKYLEMYFNYKGYTYFIIRGFQYPESERKQHKEEQSKINNKIERMKNPKQNNYTSNIEKDLESFFKIIEED